MSSNSSNYNNYGTNPGTGWLYKTSIVGDCSGNTFGKGFYYDTSGNDGSSNCQGTGDPDDPRQYTRLLSNITFSRNVYS